MALAIVHLECETDRQIIWRDAMRIRTTEATRGIYPEAVITMTAIPDRRSACHSKNIPEARIDMISDSPNPVLATASPRREYCSKP